MPRGRAKGYDEQREQIVARAAVLFARRGYNATSMNDVAEACGVSKPALYHYVSDKHQLLVEISEGHVERLLGIVARVTAQGGPPEAVLRDLIAAFVAVYASSQSEHRVLTEDVRFLRAAEQRRVLASQRRVVAAFAAAIVAARPEVEPARLGKPLAMLLFGMMNWMFTWLRPDGRLRHFDMAGIVGDLFFGGLSSIGSPACLAPSLSSNSNGDTACAHPELPVSASPPPPSPRRARSRAPTSMSA